MITKGSMTNKFKPPIKCVGDKWHLKDFIISHLPENYEQMIYVEPFCSGGTIFLNKNASVTEVISDIDEGIICVFKAIRDEPKEFFSRIKRATYTERSFKLALGKAQHEFEDYIDKAFNEYVLRRMSRAGSKKSFSWTQHNEDEINDDAAWATLSEKIEEMSTRLTNTTILCKNFVEIMKFWDETETVFYLDPPELKSIETDSQPFEMSVDDHMNMIHLAKNSKGKVIISGFSCPLYNRSLKNWKCKKKPNQNKTKKVECVWINY